MMNSINNVSVLVLALFFVATTFGYQNNFYDINYGLTGFTPYIPTQQLFRQYFHPLVMPYDEFGPLYYPPKCMFEHKEEEENSLIESRESIDGHNDNYYVSEENARGFSSLLKNFMISRKRTYSDKCSGGIQAWHQNFGLYRYVPAKTRHSTAQGMLKSFFGFQIGFNFAGMICAKKLYEMNGFTKKLLSKLKVNLFTF